MELIWYITIACILIVFFILDGYDFGTGIIHLFYAKKEEDKVVVAKAAGLFWDSNEVWLVVAGGLLFMAFPTFYASAFSGFYLPLIMVLWLIIFRAIGLELRNQFNHSMWHKIWDKSFGVSSLLLALFFGIALGNIVRGVNLGGHENNTSLYEGHYFFLPLWNPRFSPLETNPGVIDWFTLTIGLIAVVVLALHGANWIILKTTASINEHLKRVVFRANLILIGLTIFSLIIWHFIRPMPFQNFLTSPWLFIFPLIYVGGIIGLLFVKSFRNEYSAFCCSSAVIIGGISTSLASIFPEILPTTNSVHPPLTIYNTATDAYGLNVALSWGIIGVLLGVVYMLVQKRILSGKIDHINYGH